MTIVTYKQSKKKDTRPKLNCKRYGIYSAQWKIYKEICVGQTKNSFNVRWNAHKNSWKRFQPNFNLVGKGDESALFKHYFENHHTDIKNRIGQCLQDNVFRTTRI